jgi:5-(carboxyamino)imidazole ribonucleotide synthase
MTAMAARTMGYDVRVLDPDPHCPAAAIATETVVAGFDDEVAAARLAEQCAVVTLEIEQISRVTLEGAARFAPLRPGVEPVYVIQERGRQKEFLAAHGFPVGPFRVVASAAECAAAIDALGPSVVKSVMGGYDGRGQARVRAAAEGTAAWESVGGRRAVVERFLDLADELSVLVARSPDGSTRAYPPARNHHAMGILTWSVLPGGFDAALAERATTLATRVAEALGIVGLLAVELFLLADGTLLVNELAPRPHNTYHHTERACVTSQFEQLVRAVCGLPLGATDVVRPAAIHNLLGDLWTAGPPDFTPVLARPGVRLHLYGKHEARPGRKMGHLSACGDTPDDALARVREAYALVAP